MSFPRSRDRRPSAPSSPLLVGVGVAVAIAIYHRGCRRGQIAQFFLRHYYYHPYWRSRYSYQSTIPPRARATSSIRARNRKLAHTFSTSPRRTTASSPFRRDPRNCR
ncbi:hypothetical protein GUJ93_ZPchr0002g23352 [Zizania palustris]|uniref:Uncharacterized protein n=1 Tax=Zizania palustris TaxID=103762 RepID=A0A8J5RVZ2_ZIZPA|nr:hypothetical protein GUJ93_ZPchr0002g23352 [Zizania palustris]